MVEKTDGPQQMIPVEPRYAREMPWVLLALAVALAVYAAIAEHKTTVDSRVTVAQVQPANATKTAAKTKPAKAPASTPTKITTTEKGPSDTLLGILFALAAVTALTGAFYARVTKVTLPGGAGLELGAVALDLNAIAKAVAAQLNKEVEKKPAEEKQAFDAERVAALVARATVRAQQQALELRAAVTMTRPAPRLIVEAPEVTRAQRGMPLSDDLVKRLAEKAVREVLAEPESPAE